MEKQILHFTVNEQALVVDEPIKISTNKVNYIQANFDLGENWSGYDSIRAIWFNDFQTISTVLDSLGNCAVPFEVMKRKGNVKVNLVGSISEDDVLTDRLTSYPVVAVIVDCTAQITGANTSPITPSEFEQFAQRVHTDAERAEAGATASEQSATESANSASASAESAQEAEAHASSAQIYAGMASNEAEASANSASEAQTYAQSASGSATDAEGYAEDAESARDTILGMRATANTLSEGSDATASYSNGLLTLGIPRGNTGAKGDKGDRGDVGATPNLSIGTVTTLDPDESATATISGTAENPVLSFGIPKGDTGEVSLQELEDATVVQTLSDNVPYNYRRTNGGNGSGTREYDEIVGASVGWNQLVQNGNFADNSAWNNRSPSAHTMTIANNKLSCTLTSVNAYFEFGQNFVAAVGHKYVVSVGKVTTPHTMGSLYFALSRGASYNSVRFRNVSTGRYESIVSATGVDSVMFLRGTVTDGGFEVGDVITFENIQIIDLTLFNSAIADYVYTLEQSTAGSGVAWLKSHFPKLFDNGYQPFDSGSIKSVSGLTAHVMCDANDNIIGNYPLDSSVTLRGKYNLDANNDLYAIGDVWSSDGTVTRPYAEIVFDGSSDEKWFLQSINSNNIANFFFRLTDSAGDNKAMCDKLSAQYTVIADTTTEGFLLNGQSILYVRISSSKASNVNDFKTWLANNNLTFVYELATPTTENATPYTNPQWCDANGTEEYVGSELPVGHNTQYPMTMVDCADGLGNGTYEARLTIVNGVKTFTWQSV